MSKGLKITLVSLLVIVAILGLSISGIWNSRNTAINLEERITAQHVTNKSEYDAMWKKIVEMTQVTELQAKQFKEVYEGLIAGRYKDENLLFKSIQEQNPQLDTSVYKNIQLTISAGRDSFHKSQKDIADMVREYNVYVQKHIIMATITHREKMDANKFIVTSERTSNAFETNKDDVIKIDGK
jgi:hypothetical protein